MPIKYESNIIFSKHSYILQFDKKLSDEELYYFDADYFYIENQTIYYSYFITDVWNWREKTGTNINAGGYHRILYHLNIIKHHERDQKILKILND